MTTDLQPAPLPLAENHREQLWHVFKRWTGDGAIADDLVQETLIEGWRSTNRPPFEPDLSRWLFGVARNVFKRHLRTQGQSSSLLPLVHNPNDLTALSSESFDIVSELEQEDVLTMLEACLALLPPETRRALLLRYADDLPQREVAERIGVSEKALESKLHRGKRAMHRHLLTHHQDYARELGLLSHGNDWQVTNLWCEACGGQRLVGRWKAEGGLQLDCPTCTLLGGRRSCHTDVGGEWISGLHSFGAAIRRIGRDQHEWTGNGLAPLLACPVCGDRTEVVRDDWEFPCMPQYWLRCRQCGCERSCSSVGATIGHPAFQQWKKRERRVTIDPSTSVIERDGRDTLHIRWTSQTGTSSYDVLRDRETLDYMLIAIDGQEISRDS